MVFLLVSGAIYLIYLVKPCPQVSLDHWSLVLGISYLQQKSHTKFLYVIGGQ